MKLATFIAAVVVIVVGANQKKKVRILKCPSTLPVSGEDPSQQIDTH